MDVANDATHDAANEQAQPATRALLLRRAVRWIAALALVATLCVVGYRRGFDAGYYVPQPTAAASGLFYLVSYPVADLVKTGDVFAPPKDPLPPGPGGSSGPPVADFDPLIDLIVSTIDSESWLENGRGGQGEIQPFPSNLSLVIGQTHRVHEQVADLFKQLRRTQGTVLPQEIVPMLQSRASYGRDGVHPLRSFAATSAGRAAVAPLFDRAVANLVDIWGAPAIRSDAGAADFPAWSTAERVAGWRRGGGIAYLAIQDDGQAAPQLLAGWRRAD